MKSMLEINIRFQEFYKELDKLCMDIFHCKNGVTQYITEMENYPTLISMQISDWEIVYKQLKRMRRIRNQLAHEVGSLGTYLCEELDISWLNYFYNSIINGNDPLTKAGQIKRCQEKETIINRQQNNSIPKKKANINFSSVLQSLRTKLKKLLSLHPKRVNFTIETERLLLRPFKKSDAYDVFEYLSNPTMNCFQEMKLNSLNDAKKLVNKRANSKNEINLAICLKETNRVIGEIFDSAEESEMDTYSPCWMLNPKFQKKGYAYEAIQAYFNYIFREKNARRIYIYTEDDNLSCQKLCEKLGMRKEGFYLEFISFVKNPDGTPKYENTYQYAILKKEWQKNNHE